MVHSYGVTGAKYAIILLARQILFARKKAQVTGITWANMMFYFPN